MHPPYVYRLAAGTDLFDFLEKFKSVINPIRDQLDAAMLAEKAFNSVDRADLRGEERPWTSPWKSAWGDYQREQATISRIRRGFDPHSLALTVGRDPESRRLIARLVFDGCREYPEAFEAMDGVEAYWSRGEPVYDQDDNEIPTDEDLVWDRVSGALRTDESMFTYDLRPRFDHSILTKSSTPEGRAMILGHVPPMGRRVAMHAQQAVIDAMLHGSEHDGTRTFMRAFRQTSEAELSATEAVIRARLVKASESTLFGAFEGAVPGYAEFAVQLEAAVAHDIAANALPVHGPATEGSGVPHT